MVGKLRRRWSLVWASRRSCHSPGCSSCPDTPGLPTGTRPPGSLCPPARKHTLEKRPWATSKNACHSLRLGYNIETLAFIACFFLHSKNDWKMRWNTNICQCGYLSLRIHHQSSIECLTLRWLRVGCEWYLIWQTQVSSTKPFGCAFSGAPLLTCCHYSLIIIIYTLVIMWGKFGLGI